jgi:serine/threonine-protein kinase
MRGSAKYKILEELGSGGMGHVYKGLVIGQAGFQRPVVMKQLRDSNDPAHLQLFVQEARRYALLDHENIGRIFDFERVAGEMCIVLEYIDGWTLADYLERHRKLGRLPEVELSVFIVSRVCRGLQYVFEKAAIVHRDVSPGNIMMTREGTVKLIDFGIATRSGTKDKALAGKPAYMAPEMVLELRADHRSDLFSLGAVLFELLTLERLFQGETAADVLEQVIAGHPPSPRALNPAIPDGVMAILRHALQRDASRRFASAAEMGGACEHYLYDKGYGPTNLTLKQYLHPLFPRDEAAVDPSGAEFALPPSALVPLEETLAKPDALRTPFTGGTPAPTSDVSSAVKNHAPRHQRRGRPRSSKIR